MVAGQFNKQKSYGYRLDVSVLFLFLRMDAAYQCGLV